MNVQRQYPEGRLALGHTNPPHALLIEPLVRQALAEDLGRAGDITTDAIVPADSDQLLQRICAEAAARADPRLLETPLDEGTQIQPSRLRLAIICVPGATNERAVYAVFDGNEVFGETQSL